MASLPRAILHVDMDAFYASVEALVHPELRNRPLIVGGDGARGVVASCSYEARAYGIRSAMPSARAKRLCPQAVFVQGSFGLYEDFSAKMHAIFREFTPLVEGLSLDEAFLDVTGAQRLFGNGTKIAWAIRDRILEQLGLVATVGVANTLHLAKLASVAGKPKATKQGPVSGIGVLTIPEDGAIEFLHGLPVRALWGVGPKAGEALLKIGIENVGQLARIDESRLARAVGNASAEHLLNLAWNRDDREVIVERAAKSVGHEQTYPNDLKERPVLHRQFVRLADAVSARLRDDQQGGRTITVKIRYGDFQTITRSRTLKKATANAATLVELADELTAGIELNRGVRLAGISVSNLEDTMPTEQMAFGDIAVDEAEEDPRRAQLDSVIDSIRGRYGHSAVVPGQLIEGDKPDVLRRGERQWGPNAS